MDRLIVTFNLPLPDNKNPNVNVQLIIFEQVFKNKAKWKVEAKTIIANNTRNYRGI